MRELGSHQVNYAEQRKVLGPAPGTGTLEMQSGEGGAGEQLWEGT